MAWGTSRPYPEVVTGTTQVYDAGTLGSFPGYPRDDRNGSFVIMELWIFIQDPLACLAQVVVAVESQGDENGAEAGRHFQYL